MLFSGEPSTAVTYRRTVQQMVRSIHPLKTRPRRWA
jgi:hypothetical protein